MILRVVFVVMGIIGLDSNEGSEVKAIGKYQQPREKDLRQ
jgi:hypothetical protein